MKKQLYTDMRMDKGNKLLAFVDKKYSEHHPFVDEVILKISKERYDIVKCYFIREGPLTDLVIPDNIQINLPRRTNIGRFFSIFNVANTIFNELSQEYRLSIFIRNEPSYLLSAIILKKILHFRGISIKVIFQSSFPHEEASGSNISKFVARLILRFSVSSCDSLIAVSKLGISRLLRLIDDSNEKNIATTSIPLFVQDSWLVRDRRDFYFRRSQHFVYIGDTSVNRELDRLIKLFLKATKDRPDIELHIYGADRLHKNSLNVSVKNEKQIIFLGNVNRDKIKEVLSQYRFGLCIIPPLPQYFESSPTKLGEYMSRGVIPIVNIEIDSLRTISELCSGVIATRFDDDSILNSITKCILLSDDEIQRMKSQILTYVNEEYTYSSNKRLIFEALLV